MRKFKMSGRRVICRNASLIGYSTNVARPGSWIVFNDGAGLRVARVLGRIERTDNGGEDCRGWIAAVRMSIDATSASIAWVNPADVVQCLDAPPHQLLSWITGADWPTDAAGRARAVAMGEFGTLSEQFIETRDDPAKPYNSRPEYATQWTLE